MRCLDRIEARRELNAFITVMRDRALADAAAAAAGDRDRTATAGALHGIPVSVKDLIDVAGTPTTSGSAVPPRHPSHDAPVVTRLREAGAVIIGKTNLHEFAFGTTSEESAFGPVRHPRDPLAIGRRIERRVRGRARGRDVLRVGRHRHRRIDPHPVGGLRHRRPEAIARRAAGDGIVPLSTTLDHVGPMARSVADVAVVFAAMRGQRRRRHDRCERASLVARRARAVLLRSARSRRARRRCTRTRNALRG